MMKVLYTTILFISSFFLFNLKNVYAEEYTYEMSEDYNSLINDDFFNLKEKVLEISNNKRWFIYLVDNSNYFYVAISQDDISVISPATVPISFTYPGAPRFSFKKFDIYSYYNSELKLQNSYTTTSYYTSLLSSSKFNLVDTNCTYSTSMSHKYNIIYNNKTYVIPDDNPTIYSIYLDNLNSGNIDKEDDILLFNFYSIIFDKLSYLSDMFATNYLFLSTLGIFILIFIVELIRRFLK